MTVVAMAHVAEAGDGIPLTLEVGRTTERVVDNALGWFCDDPSFVEATLETRGDINVWSVQGKKPGTTQCRVGTDVSRVSYVFDVVVKPAVVVRPAPVVVAPKVEPKPEPKPEIKKAPAKKPAVKKPAPKKKPVRKRPTK